jgi:hypothetical protein
MKPMPFEPPFNKVVNAGTATRVKITALNLAFLYQILNLSKL